MEFPCIAGARNKSRTWPLTEDHLRELTETFPGVNVLPQCRQALAWLRADPKRTKTADGMSKFLYGWMAREQNNPRRGQPQPAVVSVETPEEKAERLVAAMAGRRSA